MPIYEEEGRITREDLFELKRRNLCKECGGRLDLFYDFDNHKAYLACYDYPRTQHEGIEREQSLYEQQGMAALNIPKRREIMEQELGVDKARALAKYEGVLSLTRPQAQEILDKVYPLAPQSEIARAVLLCVTYQFNPLMKHVFLVKFNRWNKDHTAIIGEDWATILGIKAKRLLASRPDRMGRPRPYSYIDGTPRVMTAEEQKTTFGKVEPDKLWVITKGKDPQTGAEAVGYGFWPKKDKPYGEEKGNTQFNMASIRSESQMLDRLRPGEMPAAFDVMPEEIMETGEVIEGEGRIIEEEPAEDSIEAPYGICPIHNVPLVAGRGNFPPYCPNKVPGTGRSAGKMVWCKGTLPDQPLNHEAAVEEESEKVAEQKEPTAPEKNPYIDMVWLEEALNTLNKKGLVAWTDKAVLEHMKTAYNVEAETVLLAIAKLDQGMSAHFVNKVQETLEMA